ncbi:MAG: RagB/SusD family nutrient uptake outer membrane protein, partial [Chitinophagaceae bacterium]|nr:RagB/SusD family nutrient uptake outer membrane protein [Chitinophagaceae bacterium]
NNQSRWYLGLHYNQTPSGWNGFTTLSDFYDKFGAGDTRLGMAYPGVTDRSGLRVGFLIGQQYDKNGTALKDRRGNPLAFTREVHLKETGNDLEITGIRVMKYPPDLDNEFPANNDYVIFRFADVLLMVAEAYMRTGDAAQALLLVNQIRLKRGATPLASVDLDAILDERGRELYWEGWRRQDLIRFGKFLQPWQEKPNDDPKYLLFAIPSEQLAVNPNLTQNPGY